MTDHAVTMTDDQFEELRNRLITFRNAAGYYVPHYADEVFAAWADLNDLLGAIRDENTRAQYVAAGQLSFFEEAAS